MRQQKKTYYSYDVSWAAFLIVPRHLPIRRRRPMSPELKEYSCGSTGYRDCIQRTWWAFHCMDLPSYLRPPTRTQTCDVVGVVM